MKFQPEDSREESFTGEEEAWETPRLDSLFPSVLPVTYTSILDHPLACKMFVSFRSGKTRWKKCEGWSTALNEIAKILILAEKKPLHFWFLQSQKLYKISFDHLTPDVPSTSLGIFSHRSCKHKNSWPLSVKTFLRKPEPLQEAAKNKHIFQVGGKCCQRLIGIFCRSGNE